jgi:hypothetical protein
MILGLRRPGCRLSVLAVAALSVLAVGCGGGEQAAPAPTLGTLAPATTAEIVTTSTEPGVVTDTSAGGDAATVDASTTTTIGVATTTSIIGWTGPVHPLTGLPAVDGTIDRPALVVKIGNNDSKSLPQLGLEDADIVYEAHIENGVTRFLAVFQSEVPTQVGPVRSARSSDIDLIGNLNRPSFAYWGSNEGVGAEVEQAIDLGTFVALTTTSGEGQYLFSRDADRGEPPYNGILDAAAAALVASGAAPDPIFTFGGPPASAVPIRGVRWMAPRRDIDWVWDHVSARWLRYHRGVPLVGADGVHLAADNVLILFVDYRTSAADLLSPQAISTGSGDGWLLRDGAVTGVTWSRPFVADGWSLADDDTGEAVFLRPGRTWVALARMGEGKVLDPAEVAELIG